LRAPLLAPLATTTATDANWCLDMLGVDTHTREFTGRGITLAVLDTGFDLHHPDQPRILDSRSFVPGEPVQDVHGHGTHCIGVAAGPLSTQGRVPYGVAPGADVLVAKVLDRHGRGWDHQILDAIDWAIDLGASIVSMSLGAERVVDEPYPEAYEAIAKAVGDRVLLVAAAGNESNEPHYLRAVGNPAACPSILAVGAIDRDSRVAPFSCRQLDTVGALDLVGPGVAVYSAWPGGGHRLLSGTSMATPQVAGLAALFAERGGTALRGKALWNQLVASARALGAARDYAAGVPRL
jgi:subtilisin